MSRARKDPDGPNPTAARRMCMEYIDQHRFMPDHVKDLAKQIVTQHFLSMRGALGALELACRRTEQKETR